MIKIITRVTLMFMLMVGFNAVIEDRIYRFTSSDYWFEYYPPEVVPIQTDTGVRFISNSEYKRNVKVTWYDTSYCTMLDGTTKRGDTNVFSDFKEAGDKSNPRASWRYQNFPEDTSLVDSCIMTGKIVARTPATLFNPSGYVKTQSYITEPFEL